MSGCSAHRPEMVAGTWSELVFTGKAG